MNWHEQAETMLKLWSDASQQAMNNWSAMAQSALETAPRFTPAMQSFGAINDLWRDLTAQGVRAAAGGADPAVTSVAEKLFASQTAMMRLVQLSFSVWQAIAPEVEAGGNWQAALKGQMDRVRADLLKVSAEGVAAARSTNQLWQTYLTQWQALSGPWLEAAQGSLKHVPDAIGGDRSALLEMTSLYWDAYQDTFGKLLRAPGVGYTREMDEKLRRGFAAWLDMQQAGFEYQVMLADTWVRAFETLIAQMVEASGRGQPVSSVREFLERWSTVADDRFKAAFRSEAYIQAQGRLVNTAMQYRVHQRQINELLLGVFDIPTRSEVDEAHRRIYELRKEIKALRQQIAELKGEAGPRPAPQPTPRKPRGRKAGG